MIRRVIFHLTVIVVLAALIAAVIVRCRRIQDEDFMYDYMRRTFSAATQTQEAI